MKADLTKSTFRREKHHSGVLMQQGRVQVDADWNEQMDIGAYLDETTRMDVIGACGMPVHAAGFGVSPLDGSSDLALSAGRAYVDGILCENDASPIAMVTVGDAELQVESVVADGRELKEGDWIEASATGVGPLARRIAGVDTSDHLLKLEQALSATEVSDLQNAGDAAIRRLTTYLTQPHFPGNPADEAGLTPEVGLYFFHLDVWRRLRTAIEDASIREVALGGPDHGTRAQTVWQVKRARVGDAGAEITCATTPPWDELAPRTTGRMSARAHPQTTKDDLCTIPPGAGFRRGENQLYRVDITNSGNLGEAEFTFSRENGSVVVPWLGSDTDTLTVTTVGRDEVLGIGPGDWVEVTDDLRELEGEPGALVKVKTALDQVITVDPGTATGSLDIADYPLNPKVRRWDDTQGSRVVERPAENDGYLPLEDGVEVRFEDGFYRALDYWLVPARATLGDIEWERDSAAGALSRPPDGVEHHYCGLALLQFDGGEWTPVEDCRQLFPPLTELPTGPAVEDLGVHVVRIRTGEEADLHNDQVITVDRLAWGIAIDCDRDIEPSTVDGEPTCLVALDLPFPVSDEKQLWGTAWGTAFLGTVAVTLAGKASVSGPTILWEPLDSVKAWLAFQLIGIGLGEERLLGHLTLKGNFIYEAGQPEINLDGEAFGLVQDATEGLVLPSGDNRRGGDLEMWFWLKVPVHE